MKYSGYAGKILEVNLSKQECTFTPFSDEIARDYLGGTGLASRILYDEIKPGIDPLGPDNMLVFASGALTGTLFPQASRYVVSGMSPITNIWGEAHSAGFFGPELKYAGVDAVVIRGVSPKPVYMFIKNGKAELRDASHLWGQTTSKTEEMLVEELKLPVRVSSIGPAGENKVRVAAIMTEGRAAARSGLGAVMGSKNLKAIAAYGTMDLKVHDSENYLNHVKEWHQRMLANSFTEGRIKFGTTNLVELMQEIGRLPSFNFREGVFDDYEKIGGEIIRQKYLVKPRSDFSCLQRCERFTCVPTGDYAFISSSPEFETQSALGSRVGNKNVESVLYGHYLCNELGMDTIGVGGTISWAMECWETGVLTNEDTEDITIPWGDHKLIIRLIWMMARREDKLGDLLAEGSAGAADRLGKGHKYLMTVKRHEIAGQNGRAQKSMGLASATAARGADHLYAFPVLDEVGFEEAIKERFGPKLQNPEDWRELGDRLNPKFKGLMVASSENFMAVVESLGLCKYGTQIPPEFYYPDLVVALKVTCGMEVSVEDLEKIGERIVNLNRLFNAREGIRRKDDTLPERLLKEPSPRGAAKGHVVELDMMLDEYYTYRGWDKETGLPSLKKLRELGLEKEFIIPKKG